jgi:hypothetical protein
MLESRLILEMRGEGGVVLLNSLYILGGWRHLVLLVIIVSLSREIFLSFVLMWRAKLKFTFSQKSEDEQSVITHILIAAKSIVHVTRGVLV